MAEPVSVTMITKNASRTIVESLNALRYFDEVILLDNGSTDNTIELAGTFSNVMVFKSPFIGFGPLKNLAASYAGNDWILSVDSDEVFSRELVDEIRALSLEQSKVYAIVRDNYYRGKWIRCCGWENDRVDRLYNRKVVSFSDAQVHESLILSDTIERVTLRHRFKHYSYDNCEELLAKMQHYSTLWAEEQRGRKRATPLTAVSRSLFAFVKFYVFKKGFLNGSAGLLISVTNANNVFYKYMKLYELENRKGRDEDFD
jgi:glycosyltransferase involved in cell wall biosynthesis